MGKDRDSSKADGGHCLILGAGPAGIACGHALSMAGRRVVLAEKDSQIGGLSKTIEIREGRSVFRTDIGPHRFLTSDRDVKEYVFRNTSAEWIRIKRRSRQYIDGRYFDYPINLPQAFYNLGPIRSAAFMADYSKSVMSYRLRKKEIRTFRDYITANFGSALGRFNMFNYTEKILGISCDEISPDWATQRITGLTLATAIRHSFSDSLDSRTLGRYFYYPKGGIGRIYDDLAKGIKERGGKISLGSRPVRLVCSKGRISSVVMDIGDARTTVSPSHVVSTIPITSLVEMLDPLPPQDVLDAASRLKWRSQVYLFITLDKDLASKDHWTYYPSESIPFGRTSEMKNFSDDMSPKGKTSLFVEYFVDEGDRIWSMGLDDLMELSMPHFERIGLFKRKEVRKSYLYRRSHVYPIYDLEYHKNLGKVMGHVSRLKNLLCIGRPGRFMYTNQDQSIEMGISAAKGMIDSKY